MVQRTQTDYETREIEETVYECDRCGAEGAENHIYGDILYNLSPLKAERVADYCEQCYDELTREEYVRVSDRKAAGSSSRWRSLTEYSISTDVWRAGAATILIAYTTWWTHFGATGGFVAESGEPIPWFLGIVIGPLLGWCFGGIALMILNGIYLVLDFAIDIE